MSTRPPLRVIEGGGRPQEAPAPKPLLGPALELASLGLGLTLTIALIARLPSWFHDLGSFQALYTVAFAFYGLAVARFSRYADLPRVGLVVFAVALATRAALLAAPPSLSGDIYRYVWEGKVAAHGENPYRLAPLDHQLAPLRDRQVFPHVNHPQLATIYPPASIAGFALVAAVSPTVTAAKLWVILHDLALILVLLAWVGQGGRSPVWVAVYAWNPLAIVEYAGNGHNDPTAMLWLAVALAMRQRRPVLSAISLAIGGLTKLAPLVALPFLWRDWPSRARWLAIGLLGTGLAWFWNETRHADSGLIAYWRTWRNNELVFHYLERLSGSFEAARWLGAALLLGVVGFAVGKRYGAAPATRLATRTALLVGPVLHPWYLGWALMFEPLGPSPPWLLLSLTAVLNYGVFATPIEGRDFHLSLGWRWVEYGLPLVAALWLQLKRRSIRSLTRSI